MKTTKLSRADAAALNGYLVRHLPGDAQWLMDLLFRKAARGDRRARRLLAHLRLTLAGWGAKVPRPTWRDVLSAERRKELAS